MTTEPNPEAALARDGPDNVAVALLARPGGA